MADNVTKRFLKLMELLKKHSGLHAVYMMLLAAARSISHLEELVQVVLVSNQRVLRQDFIILRKYWSHVWAGKEAGGGKIDNAQLLLMLCQIMAGKNNLSSYYAHRLDEGREHNKKLEQGTALDPKMVISYFTMIGHGYHYFTAKMCGIRFKVGCTFIGNNHEQMVVDFRIWSHELDEGSCHKILNHSLLASSQIVLRGLGWGRVSSGRGEEVNFIFIIPSNGLWEATTKNDERGYSEWRVAGRSFCMLLEKELARHLGLETGPIGKLALAEKGDPHSFTDADGRTWAEVYSV